jgi:tRNA(Ile)-lysidine synthase
MRYLLQHCVQKLRTHGALQRGASLVVAASGGLDSTVLCDLLREISNRWLLELRFAYIHHGLREEANREADFVRTLAENCRAGFHMRTVDVRAAMREHKTSIQDAARRLRYEALEHIRVETESLAVLTAHHADDQTETLLAHFFRGSGVRGLLGIRPALDTVVRPLLDISRAELRQHAERHGLSWLEDASNLSDVYTRNALRQHVIPLIEEHVSPGIRQVMNTTAKTFTELNRFLDHHTQELLPQVIVERTALSVTLDLAVLKGYFEFERMLVLRSVAASLCGNEASFNEVQEMLHLVDASPGRRTDLHGDVTALRERSSLTLYLHHDAVEALSVIPGETVRYGGYVFSSKELERNPGFSESRETEIIDLDRSGSMWRLRPWTTQDVFHPFGAEGLRRVRDLLASEGMSGRRRQETPVLEGSDGIIWVCGVRLDAHAALTEHSRRYAAISFYQSSQE